MKELGEASDFQTSQMLFELRGRESGGGREGNERRGQTDGESRTDSLALVSDPGN